MQDVLTCLLLSTFFKVCDDSTACTTLAKKKMATLIMHKIRTLFFSRNITRLARWRSYSATATKSKMDILVF